MVDIDSCEYCKFCSEPLALIEWHEARYTKHATVTAKLARMAGISAYSIAFQANEERDITDFWVREVFPDPWPEDVPMGPADYAVFLEGLRTEHWAKYGGLGECKKR